MGAVLALGLVLVVIFRIPKFYLLWVLYVGYAIDLLVGYVLREQESDMPEELIRIKRNQIIGQILIGLVLLIITAIKF